MTQSKDPYDGHSIYGQKWDGPALVKYGPWIKVSDKNTPRTDRLGRANFSDLGNILVNDNNDIVCVVKYVGESKIQEAIAEEPIKRHSIFRRKLEIMREKNGDGAYNGPFYCLVYDRLKHPKCKGLYEVPNDTLVEIKEDGRYGIVTDYKCDIGDDEIAWTWEWRDNSFWRIGIINIDELPGKVDFISFITLGWNDFVEIRRGINVNSNKDRHFILDTCKSYTINQQNKELKQYRYKDTLVYKRMNNAIIGSINSKLLSGRKLDAIKNKTGVVDKLYKVYFNEILKKMKEKGFITSKKPNSVYVCFEELDILVFGKYFGVDKICRKYKNILYVFTIKEMKYSTSQEKLFWEGIAKSVPWNSALIKELEKLGEIPKPN